MPAKIDRRHKVIGGRHRALSRYCMMCNRVKNTESTKNRNYANIQIIVSKEDFISWFMENDFDGCSVDRIDKNGHYELSNMQLISLAENIAKDKLISKDGMCRCFVCKETKPLNQFAKDNRRISTGRSTCCKSCDNKRSINKAISNTAGRIGVAAEAAIASAEGGA